ncbi:MAG: ribonuclease P protein component [Methanosarcinales archaeon]
MNNYLHKSEILTNKINFSNLFKNGKILNGKYVNIIYNNAENFKIGFTVSKKIKGSVKKNKIKRQLKEIYRTNKIEFPKNKLLTIYAKKDQADFLNLKKDILSTIKKCNDHE